MQVSTPTADIRVAPAAFWTESEGLSLYYTHTMGRSKGRDHTFIARIRIHFSLNTRCFFRYEVKWFHFRIFVSPIPKSDPPIPILAQYEHVRSNNANFTPSDKDNSFMIIYTTIHAIESLFLRIGYRLLTSGTRQFYLCDRRGCTLPMLSYWAGHWQWILGGR